MFSERRIVIFGGGPCGLGTAIRLTDLQHDNWQLYEQENNFGGLSASFVDEQGYIWDQGGHVGHSHYAFYDKVLLELGPKMVEYDRSVKALWADGKYAVDYPVQLHADQLPPDVKTQQDLVDPKAAESHPESFAAWVIQKFGWGLYHVFFKPYNEKIWTYPLWEMSNKWVAERVAEESNRPKDKSASTWGPNAKMLYPVRGGIGAVWQGLGEHLDQSKVHLSTAVKSIKVKSREALVGDECKSVKYDYLVSTLPLPNLCAILDGEGDDDMNKCINHLRDLCGKLKFSHTHLIGLGLVQSSSPGLENTTSKSFTDSCHWLYFPEPEVPFYRCFALSNLSPHMCPIEKDNRKRRNLLFEIARRPAKFGGPSDFKIDQDFINQVVEAAKKYNLFDSTWEIESVWTKSIYYGYPTPFLERDSIVDEVLKVLETKCGILSRGRFGLWKYEISNMDHCFMQGVQVASHILSDKVGTDHTCNVI